MNRKKVLQKFFFSSLLFFPIIGPFSELNPKGNSKTIVEIVELTNKKMEHFFNGFYFSIILPDGRKLCLEIITS